MPNTASATFSISRLQPYMTPDDAPMVDVTIAPNLTLAQGTLLGELRGNDAIQTVTSTATGATATWTWGGITTATIAFGATAATIQGVFDTAYGKGNFIIGGGPLNTTPITVEFTGIYGFAPQPTLIVVNAGLTGGTAVPATTTTGSIGTPGTYKAYNQANTDGSQFPAGILTYATVTDASSNATLAGEFGQTYKAIPMYMGGTFRCEDLVGLDLNALAVFKGEIIQGTILKGIVRFG